MATINDVTCTISGSTLTVNVSWDSPDPGTLVIYDAASIAVPGTVTNSGAGFAVWQPAAGAMTAGQAYWAQVTIQQVSSLKVPLLWVPVTGVSTLYDGRSVTVAWTAPAGKPTAGNYNVTLTQGQVTQSVNTSGTTITFVPEPSLAVGTPWNVAVVPTLNVSTGPVASGTVITSAVAVTTVSCTSTSATTGQIAIVPASSTYTSFKATLAQGGTVVLSQTLPYTAGQPMVLPLPSALWPLSPLGGYSISLQPVSGTSTGPAGTALPVVTTAPTILLATIDQTASPTVSITVALPPGVPEATGFVATVSKAGAAIGSGAFVGSTGTIALPSGLTADSYTLTVAASAGPSSTGPLADTALLTAVPGIATIDNDSGLLTIAFTPATGSSNTWAEILVAGAIAVSGEAQASPIRLAAPPDGVPFQVALRASAPGLLGPAAGPVAMLCEAPKAQGVSFQIAGGAVVTWTAPAAPPVPGGYIVEVYDGAKVAGSSSVAASPTSAPLPAGGDTVGAAASATVRATATDSGTKAGLTGPRSAGVPVLVNPPGPVEAAYDGATARLSWSAPAGSAVDGYLVTLTDSAGGVAAVTSRVAGTAVSIPYASKPASIVTVAVQAIGGNAVGPASTAPLFTPALYPSTDTGKAAYLAPSASLNFGTQPLAIYLPAVLVSPSQTLPSNASFELATTATAPWTYLLTVKPSAAVWDFDASPIRAPLLADFNDFMTQMSSQGLTPRGDLLLRQAIARTLPLTFVETLFYAYNFNAADGGAGQGQGLVDLTPGMALRVELQSYETLPASTATSGNAGMVGAAVFDYDIGGYGSGTGWRQGMDAFLSRLVGRGMTVPPPNRSSTAPTQTGAGGGPDFYYPNFLQPYYRLVFPPTFLPSVDIAVSNNLRNNVTLLAAATRSDLDSQTVRLRDSSGSYSPVNAVYFRGRTMISPRLHVLLNGIGLTVPLGTTVANLLERYAGLAAAGGREAQLLVHRGLNGVAIQNWPATLAVPVRLDWTGGWTAADGSSWMDLPLLHGDRIDVDLG